MLSGVYQVVYWTALQFSPFEGRDIVNELRSDIENVQKQGIPPKPTDGHLRFLHFDLDGIVNELRSDIESVESEQFPAKLRKFATYDISAKQAMIDLTIHLRENNISLPLIKAFDRERSAPEICVAILTINRPTTKLSFITQSLSALLNRISKPDFERIYMHVFNVDREPESHTKLDLIRHLVPVTDLPMHKDERDSVKKYNRDLAEVLRIVNTWERCQHPLILEEDALATLNWDREIDLAIEQIEAKYSSTNWLMAKLFTCRVNPPSRLATYGINSYFHEYMSQALFINKVYLAEWAEYVDRAGMSDELEPVDHCIANFKEKKELQVPSFEPVIFQHVGISSGLGHKTYDETTDEFSWWFESKFFLAEGEPIVFNSSIWDN